MCNQVLITQPSEEESGGNAAIGLSVYIPFLTSVLSPCCILSVNLSCRHGSCLSFNSLSSQTMGGT